MIDGLYNTGHEALDDNEIASPIDQFEFKMHYTTSSTPNGHAKTLDCDSRVKEYGCTWERQLRHREEARAPVGRPHCTQREQIKAEGGDATRGETSDHARNKSSRRHSLHIRMVNISIGTEVKAGEAHQRES